MKNLFKPFVFLSIILIQELSLNAQNFAESEPNNTFGQANLLTAPSILIDSMGSTSDVDYFKINLKTSAVLIIDLVDVAPDQFIRLYAFNASYSQIGFIQPNGGNGSGFSYHLLLPAGISYFTVQDFNKKISSKALVISLTLDTSDKCEINNSFAAACLIEPNITLHPQIFGLNSDFGGLDQEYYKLDLQVPGVLSINLSNIGSKQIVRLFAYNSNQQVIGSTQSPNDGSGFTYAFLLPKGISYLKFLDFKNQSDSTHWNLKLSFDTTDPCEINNSFATACLIEPNIILHPQIFGINSDYNNFDEDYYKLNLKKAGVLSVDLSNIGAGQFIRLNAYDTLQQLIGTVQSPNKGSGFIFDLLLPAGVTFLKFYDLNNFMDSTHWNLKLSFDSSDMCEINNSFAKACYINATDTFQTQLFGFNSSYSGPDDDYYKFETSNCLNQCFEVSGLHSSQSIILRIYNDQLNLIGSKSSPSTGIGYKYCLNLGIGSYYIKLSESNGKSNSTKITISASNSPTLPKPVITGIDKICAGDSIVLSSDKKYLNRWSTGDTTQSIYIKHAGTYLDTSFDNKGCWNISVSKTIEVNQPIIPTITQTGNNLNSSDAVTFQWYRNDSLIIGATNQTLTLVSDGKYKVATTDINGCRAISQEFTANYVGLNGNNILSNISLYPNPANESLIIFWDGFEIPALVQMFDHSGKKAKEFTITEKQTNIDLFDINSGIYFLKFLTENGVSVLKFIVE